MIAGLVVNGAQILELAATKDGRVTTKGDVQLLPAGSLLDRAAPLQRMQQVNRVEQVLHGIVKEAIVRLQKPETGNPSTMVTTARERLFAH